MEAYDLAKYTIGLLGLVATSYGIVRNVVKGIHKRIDEVETRQEQKIDSMTSKVNQIDIDFNQLKNQAVTQQQLDQAFQRQGEQIQSLIQQSFDAVRSEIATTNKALGRIESRVDGLFTQGGRRGRD